MKQSDEDGSEWPNNIIADRHERSGLWVLHYLTDEQAKVCYEVLRAASQGEG